MRTSNSLFTPFFFGSLLPARLLVASGALFVAPLCQAQDTPVSRVQTEADKTAQAALDNLHEQLRPLVKTQPQQTATLIETFLRETPALSAKNAAFLQQRLAMIYLVRLKDPSRALAVYDEALQPPPNRKLPPLGLLALVGGKARVLTALKRAPEAEALVRPHLPRVAALGLADDQTSQSVAIAALEQLVSALEAQGKGAEAAPLLEAMLWQSPALLGAGEDELGRAVQRRLIEALQGAGHTEQALGYARLSLMVAPFAPKEMEGASQQLATTWAKSEGFAQIKAFQRAQVDGAAPNPLAQVPLPVLSGEAQAALQARIEQLNKGKRPLSKGRTHQLITLLLATNRMGPAMKEAWGLLTASPTLPAGAREVARVFKAADLNPLRANAFIDYLDGKGPNPLPLFWEQFPTPGMGNVTATAPTATAPVAAAQE